MGAQDARSSEWNERVNFSTLSLRVLIPHILYQNKQDNARVEPSLLEDILHPNVL
jgi:hypothetical protein